MIAPAASRVSAGARPALRDWPEIPPWLARPRAPTRGRYYLARVADHGAEALGVECGTVLLLLDDGTSVILREESHGPPRHFVEHLVARGVLQALRPAHPEAGGAR